MKLFVINTKSESSDYYSYVVKHPQMPTQDELKGFLTRECCDRDSTDGEIYEHIQSVFEVSEETALLIPEVSAEELENWKYCGE